MNDEPASSLFDFALSGKAPTTTDEEILMDLHIALGMSKPPATLLRFPAVKRQTDWQRFLYATIAAALVIAMISVSFRFLYLNTGDDHDDIASVPPVVLGLASPNTAEDAAACETTRSIPLITGATSAPTGIVAIILTPDGDLKLDCSGSQSLLASGSKGAVATSWPGVIRLILDNDSTTYLNVFNGNSYAVHASDLLSSPRNTLGILSQRSTGRMTIVPASNDPDNVAILDLDSLTEIPVADHNGQPILLSEIPVVTSNYQGDCMVLAYSYRASSQNTDYLSGFVNVTANGESTAIAAPSLQQPVPRELATSPTCDQVASVTFQGEATAGTTTVSIQSFTDDAEVTARATTTPDWLTHVTWLKSGNGIVYGGADVLLWEKPFGSTEPVTLAEGLMTDTISLTRDPDVVAISTVNWNASADEVSERTLIVDIAARNVTEIDHVDMYPSLNVQPVERNILLMRSAPIGVYDATTGERLGEVGGDTVTQQDVIVAAFDSQGSAEIGLIGSSLDNLWRILDSSGTPTMERIEPPAGLEVDGMPTVAMSHDGWVYLSSPTPTTNGWLKNLDDPAADWVEVDFSPDSNARVQFLARGDQQNAPETTPVTACDLTQNFPLVLYANDFPVDATTLLLNDNGDLLFRCAGSDDVTVIATDVVAITRTGLPSTIVVSARDENSMEVINGVPASSQLVNLTTGDHLDVGVGSLSMRLQQAQHSPWHLATNHDDSLTPIVVDLRTLEPHPLLSENLDTPALIAMATSSRDGSITATATLRDKYSLNLRSVDVEDASTPLEILIIRQTWEDHTTFTIDDIGGRASGISMSPDGSYLTIEVLDSIGFNSNNEPTQLLIIDTSTGEIVAQTDADEDAVITEPVWTSDSSTFLYLSDNNLRVLEPAVSSSPREVFAGELALSNLALTSDPNVVLVMEGVSEDGATYHRVHLDTGTSEPLGQQGWEVGLLYFHRQVPIISLSNGGTITWQDSATDEILEQSSLTATPESGSETSAVNLYIGSPVYAGAISESSTIWVWGDDLQVRAIDVPNTPTGIFGSPSDTTPNGRYIIVSEAPQGFHLNEEPVLPRTLYFLDTLAEEPEWIPVQATTPVASQASCDLTQDMPLFIGVDTSPIEGTAVLLTPGGELVLTCGETQETLVDGVTTASNAMYQGVIYLESTSGTGFYSLPLRQIFTLSDPAFLQSEVNMTANTLRSTGRWWIVPSTDQSTHASLLDLQTFTETQLLDGDGNRLKLSDIGAVASNYDDDTIVIAYSQYRADLRTSYLRGYVVVAKGEQEALHSLASAQAMPRELAVAPDGSYYATATYQGDESRGTTTINVYARSSATPIKSFSFSTPNGLTFLTWLKSGEGLAFTDGSYISVLRAPYQSSDVETLVESENITGIALTRDPDIITATSFRPAQSPGTPPSTLIINTSSGEVITLEGQDIFMPSMLQTLERNVLLLRNQLVMPQDGASTIQVHDALTGELLGEMKLPVQASSGFSSSQYGYGRGEISIIAFNADSIWLLLDGNEPMLRQIPAPEGINGASPVSVQMSEDGWIYLRVSGSPSQGWLMAPGGTTWTEIEFAPGIESPGVTFVLGIP